MFKSPKFQPAVLSASSPNAGGKQARTGCGKEAVCRSGPQKALPGEDDASASHAPSSAHTSSCVLCSEKGTRVHVLFSMSILAAAV